MDEPKDYPTPWREVWSLWRHIGLGTRADCLRLYQGIAAHLDPSPVARGLERLPASPRFVLAANHHEREGLWIAYPAAALAVIIGGHYGLQPPPLRWVVTANFPRWQVGPWRIPSPGDLLLPRVAHAVYSYPVAFAKTNPAFSARSLRRLLRDARALECPLGLFPEGVAGKAGRPAAPLPGVERLLVHLARLGLPVQPVAISERPGLEFDFGDPIAPSELVAAPHAGQLVMERICLFGRFQKT